MEQSGCSHEDLQQQVGLSIVSTYEGKLRSPIDNNPELSKVPLFQAGTGVGQNTVGMLRLLSGVLPV